MNVLWWIWGRSRQFKSFVANRVGEIQSNTDPEQWRCVPTSMNPADILSRGMRTEELIGCSKWWKGPDFLSQSEGTWPLRKVVEKPDDNIEMKKTKKSEVQLAGDSFYTHEEALNKYVTAVELSGQFTVDPQRYSNWSRLKRVTARINRFTNNCQKQKGDRKSGELLTDETKNAEVQLIKWVQRTDFKEEWLALSQGKLISPRSKLLGMKPMLDENGLICSDGRLAHA